VTTPRAVGRRTRGAHQSKPLPGLFTLVLHTHLPWLAHHGRWPVGEEWLYQSWAAAYLPLVTDPAQYAAAKARAASGDVSYIIAPSSSFTAHVRLPGSACATRT